MDEKTEMQKFYEDIEALVKQKFRFSIINNPEAKKLTLVSATNVDQIKHKFPDFYIYLNGNQKIVERVYFY